SFLDFLSTTRRLRRSPHEISLQSILFPQESKHKTSPTEWCCFQSATRPGSVSAATIEPGRAQREQGMRTVDCNHRWGERRELEPVQTGGLRNTNSALSNMSVTEQRLGSESVDSTFCIPPESHSIFRSPVGFELHKAYHEQIDCLIHAACLCDSTLG